MLDERVIDKLVDRLVLRVESTNTYILKQIGTSIKELGTITPANRNRLIQALKYGGNYNKIVDKLVELTNLNVNDIYEIFEEVAKNDYRFAKQFYDYKEIEYIPYEKNIALQRQVKALARITAEEYINISKTKGFAIKKDGKTIYTDLSKMYQQVIDEGIIAIEKGKDTFDSKMTKIIKDLSNSGIRIIDYENGYSRRLDSAVRMNLKEGLSNLHNIIQEDFGKEFGYNLIEVSHHLYSAPDHIDTVDGKQFADIERLKGQIKSGEEKTIKLSDIVGNKVKVNGKWYEDYNSVNSKLDRPVSTLNCYHYVFTGLLGVSEPNHTEEELEKDKQKNKEGFVFEDKHYTMYEGTQLQRQIETEIRKTKDTQIMARASLNNQIDMLEVEETIKKTNKKLNSLLKKYKDLSKASGLPTRLERAKISGFRRIKA